MLRVNAIANIATGRGLARDVDVLREALHGAEVRTVPMDAGVAPPADLNIFCEVPVPRLFGAATRQFLVPNPEWWQSSWDELLPRFQRVLCKTEEARGMFAAKHGKVLLVGWCSEDVYDPAVPKERCFLHLGESTAAFRGTDLVIRAWVEYGIQHPLTIRARPRRIPHGSIVVQPRMPRPEFLRELNRHAFYLCPSTAEGWSHGVHEAASAGAVILATDAAPMNDQAAFRLPCTSLGITHLTTPAAIRDAVGLAMALSDRELAELGARARRELLESNVRAAQAIRNAIL